MSMFGDTKNSSFSPRSILGGMGWFEEDNFEKETSVLSTITSTVTSVAKDLASGISGGVYEAAADLSQTVIMTENKAESNGKFPSKGSIENFNKQQDKKAETDRKKVFFQALKEDADRAQRAKDRLLLEEEINDIATNLPTEQKNQLLHYQASYKDRSIYQRAELRKKLIEMQRKNKKQEKAASVPSPAKASAVNAAMEGGSGTQGSGTANLSAMATG